MDSETKKFLEAIKEPLDTLIKKVRSDTDDPEVKADKYVESIIHEKLNNLWDASGDFDKLLEAITDLVAVLGAAYYIVDVEYKKKFENTK